MQLIIDNIGLIGFDLLLLSVMGGVAFLFLKYLGMSRKHAELFDMNKTQTNRNDKRRFQFSYFTNLRYRLKQYYQFKSGEDRSSFLYVVILSMELIIFIAFLLAIAFPLLIHWFIMQAVKLISLNIHIFVEKDLPIAIKQLIKNLSKTSDMKVIMYEVSRTLKDPLRGKFFDLSRKLVTENYEKCLIEFGDELDNTWIYAFVFLLLSYKEQSRKADIIKNLILLADMLEKENDIKDKALTDKKSVIILNYGLAIVAMGTFFVNIITNDFALTFFFNSLGGMFCMMIGFTAVACTFLMNMMLSRKTF
jgi:hypothetical protein